MPGLSRIEIRRLVPGATPVSGQLLFLSSEPRPAVEFDIRTAATNLVLLTNDRGGMTRLGVDFGRIQSNNHCLLGANLHASVPVDRHVFVKRLRAWAMVDGFTSPLDAGTLESFEAGPPASWCSASAAAIARSGCGSPSTSSPAAIPSPSAANASTVPTRSRPMPARIRASACLARFDLEDRSFHSQTKHNGGADHHFASNSRRIDPASGPGFSFRPAIDRTLEIRASQGIYHEAPEWSHNIGHPFEASRGQEGSGDAWSPGWFEVPLNGGASVDFVVDAEQTAIRN